MWRRISFLQTYCIACIIVLGESSSRLSPRKSTPLHSYDPYIICDLPGPTHAEGLPSAYSEEVYAGLLTLCSTANGARQNVGCFCSSSTGRVHCEESLADMSLWNVDYTPDDDAVIHQFEVANIEYWDMTFQSLCQHGCKCRDPGDADKWYQHNTEVGALSGANGMIQPPEPPRSAMRGNRNTFGAGSFVSSVQPDHNEIQWQNQCGKNCTSIKDCNVPAGGDSTCSCQAHSSQYQPGSGSVAFIAACLVTLGSGGGKRQDSLPCPCNITYVSHGCCGVLDGLVWEQPESNLGRLLIVNDDA